jgi:multicomponent Na+:H+ antiporter subunit E
MIYAVWNLFLALIWAAATTEITLVNLLVGYAIGYVVLWFMHPLGPTNYFRKVWQIISFIGFFLKEMFLANLRVAYDVVTPTHYMRPGIIAIPLDAKTNLEIALVAVAITLTPGTLALGVSDDHKLLYIHAMFIDDPDQLRRELKDGMERRLLEVMR